MSKFAIKGGEPGINIVYTYRKISNRFTKIIRARVISKWLLASGQCILNDEGLRQHTNGIKRSVKFTTANVIVHSKLRLTACSN
jgi:hypothetical protein